MIFEQKKRNSNEEVNIQLQIIDEKSKDQIWNASIF